MGNPMINNSINTSEKGNPIPFMSHILILLTPYEILD